MARDVRGRITLDDQTKRGTDSAERNLDDFGKKVAKIGTAIAAAWAAFQGAGKVVEQVRETTRLFAEQEKVMRRLASASRNNPMISGEAVGRLADFAAEMQRVSTFGDEAIIQQEAFLTSLGMTEEQIQDVIRASVDLASTGMFSLESAVRNVAKTFSGLSGELGESIPALRELTQEQLRAGEAVEVLQQQFGGLGEAVAQSFEGQRQQIANQVGDIKEQIGGIFAALQSEALPAVRSVLDGIGRWFDENGPKIFAIFSNLPAIAGTAFETVVAILRKTFSLQTIGQIFLALGQFLLSTLANAFDFVVQFGLNRFRVLFSPIEMLGRFIMERLQLAFANVVNFFAEQWHNLQSTIARGINDTLLGSINRVRSLLGKENPLELISGPGEFQAPVAEPQITRITELWSDMLDNMGSGVRGMIDAFTGLVQEQAQTLGDFGADMGDIFAEELGAGAEKLNAILEEGRQKFEDFSAAATDAAIAAGTEGGGGGPSFGRRVREDAAAGVNQPSFGAQLLGGFMRTIGAIAGKFGELFGSLASVQAVLSPLQTIFQGMMQVLGPMIDSVLQPLNGILIVIGRLLGQILAPVFEALGRVTQFLGEAFVWLYNKVLRPVGDFLRRVFAHIGNGLISFANALIWVVNIFLRKSKEIDYISKIDVGAQEPLSEISLDDVNAAGTSATNQVEDGTGSLTAGRRITINQTINTPLVLTGGAEIASFDDLVDFIMVRLREVEQLG